jgi:DHA1 family bicyclomycin/chloramphenicol resistance-like MFS transporter
MTPSLTLLVLDLHPERRGMASSLQTFITATVNALVAGVLAPLVMHSTVLLAASALVFVLVGLVAWLWVHQRWPEVGRSL